MKFISIPVFIVSLAVGLFFVYITNPEPEIIYIYPTPENINKIQYQDKANNCYNFQQTQVECPSNTSKIKIVPIQN